MHPINGPLTTQEPKLFCLGCRKPKYRPFFDSVGTNILGYSNKQVDNAVINAIQKK